MGFSFRPNCADAGPPVPSKHSATAASAIKRIGATTVCRTIEILLSEGAE
jgi:hypothetical protein